MDRMRKKAAHLPEVSVVPREPPPPTIGILVSEDPLFAERADEQLADFGTQ